MLLICMLATAMMCAYQQYHRFLPAASIERPPLSAEQIARIRQQTPITEIRVFKAKRTLALLNQQQIVRTYPMRLGFAPIGYKQQEGDGKTPEGRYIIDWRNSNSAFYKSLHISYPNAQDRARAQASGVSAGGNIMIHGSSNRLIARLPGMMNYLPQKDWTQGCVAIRNVDMDELWALVDQQTPMVIYP